MVSDVQSKILSYLRTEGTASSSQIADHLGVSRRTVISYVRRINEAAGSAVIVSGSSGYSLGSAAASLLAQETEAEQDRRIREILAMLGGTCDEANLLSLASSLHYSESTIRSDLYGLKGAVDAFGLELAISKSHARIEGSELAKREFLCSFFEPDIDRALFDFSQLAMSFPGLHIAKLWDGLEEALAPFRRDISDFGVVNLFYRLAICLSRSWNGHVISDEVYDKFLRPDDRAFACTLAQKVRWIEGKGLRDSEIVYLAVLFASLDLRSGLASDEGTTDLSKLLWPELRELVVGLAQSLSTDYQIDLLHSPEAYAGFALHVRALVRRMHVQLRATNAVAFDAAAAAAATIEQHYGMKTTEDEIAFLALSLAEARERSSDGFEPLQLLFVLPSYHRIDETLCQRYSELLRHYVKCRLVAQVQSPGDVCGVDIVASVFDLGHLDVPRFMKISPVPNLHDLARLYECAHELHEERVRGRLHQLVATLADERHLFFHPEGVKTREDVFAFLGQKLEEEGTVRPGFAAALAAREEIASTAEGLLALPHPTKPLATRQLLCVLVPSSPIPWGDARCRLVVLLCPKEGRWSEEELELFQHLVQIAGMRERIQTLTHARTMAEFVESAV